MYTIEAVSEQNVDTPLTNFPVSEDTFDRMSDISADLISAAIQYDTYWQAGNMDGCATVLQDNPNLKSCLFNAEKYNQLRDAILALERFFLNQVSDLYDTVAQNAIGINDEPTDEQSSITSYSAQKVDKLLSESEEKINQNIADAVGTSESKTNEKLQETDTKIDKLHNQRYISLPASGWSSEYPYTQTVSISGITASDNLKVIGVSASTASTLAQVKAIKKAFGYLFSDESTSNVSDGKATFYAYKKPTVNLQIITEGA